MRRSRFWVGSEAEMVVSAGGFWRVDLGSLIF